MLSKKVGVTGGGYVGSAIIERLLFNNVKVKCIDNFHASNCAHLLPLLRKYSNFEFIEGDINNRDDVAKFCNGVDIILNTASIVGFPACEKYPELAKKTHTEGVKNLLDLRGYNCPFVQFSTDSCYGKNDEYCSEESKLNPTSLYGETKAQAEEITLNERDTIVLRFSTGMGISHNLRIGLLVHDFVHDAIDHGELRVFEPEASRSFIHVSDMAKAATYFGTLLLQRENKHRIYNIGSDDLNFTKGELAGLVSKYTKCHVSYIDGKDSDNRDYSINHSRQYEAGFKPQVSMVQTIHELMDAYPILHQLKK